MNIQGFGSVSQLYSTSAPIATKRTPNDDGGTLTSNGSTSVSISSEASIKARIDEIVAKPAAQRSEDDVEFLHNNGRIQK